MDNKLFDISADRFINNEMEPEERLMFCQEMEENKELREFVMLRKLLIEGELMAVEQEAKLAMKQFSTTTSKKHFRWIAVACISILLIGASILGNSYKYDTSYIYDTYSFIPPIERSRSEGGLTGETADVNDKIVALFDENKYKEVISVIQGVSPNILDNLPVHSSLYIAISLLETNQPQKAMSILSHLSGTAYKEEIEWLQLCTYLKMDKRSEATKIAQKIIAAKGYYSSKANQLLNKMNERRWF